MPSQSPPAKKPRKKAAPRTMRADEPEAPPLAVRLADWGLIAAFLALTFLLGAFPLKDTDFWWHLRTGDLIRQTGQVPAHDLYTYTVPKAPWIDLHWGFQVAISWVYAHWGIVGLNLAKCAVTCAAVFLLVTARRRDWPVWAMLFAWLPALLLLGGRMYVRPETLSLFYLSVFLAVLNLWERWPALAFVLPLAQVAWVNTQGLFVFGPVLVTFGLIDTALRPGAFAAGRKRWWRITAPACALTFLACLANPYGVSGALYPLQLAQTMRNPLFTRSTYRIAELTPIPLFIRETGFNNLPLQLHFLTLLLGALSFLVPLVWSLRVRWRGRPEPAETEGKKPKNAEKPRPGPEPILGLSPLRLLLFGAFGYLSWQATRNSHQFAAVFGTITAWNMGEWAAALRRRRQRTEPAPSRLAAAHRLLAFLAIVAVFGLVATGRFYAWTREGRTIGLGEEPLWYPHDAVKFAGRPGMPDRFLGYHIGHPSLYEYYHGPERKVFADARLEVIGPELYQRYADLRRAIVDNDPGWMRTLDDSGNPAILVGHAEDAVLAGALMASPRWRCVWFDPVASVYLALARPLVLLGLDHARRLERIDPDGLDGWKVQGQLELSRGHLTPSPRYRASFNPVFDLSVLRATYAFRRALEATPDDFLTLYQLGVVIFSELRAMPEAALPLHDRLRALRPLNPHQVAIQAQTAAQRASLVAQLGPEPPATWANLSELDRIVSGLLSAGRVESAADFLDRAYAGDPKPWDVADRLATLRLHLGDPARARTCWSQAVMPPSPALRAARVGATYLIEGDFPAARAAYREALAADPALFEARYGLAVLEQDDSHAAAALAEAHRAEQTAPDNVARDAARVLIDDVAPYVPAVFF
jgi:tetratricopeptide (TPR) repeat protein